jgi:hypothetical protein
MCLCLRGLWAIRPSILRASPVAVTAPGPAEGRKEGGKEGRRRMMQTSALLCYTAVRGICPTNNHESTPKKKKRKKSVCSFYEQPLFVTGAGVSCSMAKEAVAESCWRAELCSSVEPRLQ